METQRLDDIDDYDEEPPRKLVAHLHLVDTPKKFCLYEGENRIGRDIENDVILTGTKVSKFHAVIDIILDDGKASAHIKDLKSSNYTFAEEKQNPDELKKLRARVACKISSKCKIKFGDTVVSFIIVPQFDAECSIYDMDTQYAPDDDGDNSSVSLYDVPTQAPPDYADNAFEIGSRRNTEIDMSGSDKKVRFREAVSPIEAIVENHTGSSSSTSSSSSSSLVLPVKSVAPFAINLVDDDDDSSEDTVIDENDADDVKKHLVIEIDDDDDDDDDTIVDDAVKEEIDDKEEVIPLVVATSPDPEPVKAAAVVIPPPPPVFMPPVEIKSDPIILPPVAVPMMITEEEEKLTDEPQAVIILFTGIRPNDADRREIAQLSATETENPRLATHVIAGGDGTPLKRTPKLMCCMSICPFILDIRWLHDSSKAKRFLDELNYVLKDADGEKKWNFDMSESVLSRKLTLRDIGFVISAGVCGVSAPVEKDMTDIIECGGGRLLGVGNWDLDKHGLNQVAVISHQDMKNDDEVKDWVASSSFDTAFLPELVFSSVMKKKFDCDNGDHRIVMSTARKRKQAVAKAAKPADDDDDGKAAIKSRRKR